MITFLFLNAYKSTYAWDYRIQIFILLNTGNCSYLSVDQLGRNLNASYFTGMSYILLPLPLLRFFSYLMVYLWLCRDGVSEGQFYQVLLYELDAIRKVNLLFLNSVSQL